MIRDERGALHIPLAGALVIFMMLGIGTWSLLRTWKHQVQTQLRIDRCVGEKTLEFRDLLNQVHKINVEIHGLRAAIVAATVSIVGIEAVPSLQTALQAEALRQDFIRGKWEVQRGLWLARQGCDGLSDIPLPLPGTEWTRDPPDSIGVQPLRWKGKMPEEFSIQLGHLPRMAAARVARNHKRGLYVDAWKAEWQPPHSLLQNAMPKRSWPWNFNLL